ncbi:MAG: hypothetical protein CM1200mP1_13640 [Candidatus Neomarinimicrobiota bacterium]|nr:MAG: hypothetical protein CM1200mP1_13640 [Candidatus Neomarinimicrobiota bacterium]
MTLKVGLSILAIWVIQLNKLNGEYIMALTLSLVFRFMGVFMGFWGVRNVVGPGNIDRELGRGN